MRVDSDVVDSLPDEVPPGQDPVKLSSEVILLDVFGGTSHEIIVREQLAVIIKLLKQLVEKESKDGQEEN